MPRWVKSKWRELHNLVAAMMVDDLLIWTPPDDEMFRAKTAIKMFTSRRPEPFKIKIFSFKTRLYIVRVK